MGWSNSPPTLQPLQPLQHQNQTTERRLKGLVLTAVLFAACGATAGHAQVYKWVDENGKTQYTDTIPPTSTDRARKELRSDGTVKFSTDRAATAEEKRLASLRAVEAAKIKAAQDEHDRKDKALLNTYTSLLDYDRVRDRALSTVAADIRTLQAREVVLNQIIASDGGFLPPLTGPVAVPVPAAPPVAGKPVAPATALKTPVVKTAGMLLLEAKSELPRARAAIVSKRHDFEALTALYANDRDRLSRLIDLENAKASTERASTAEQKVISDQPAVPAKKR